MQKLFTLAEIAAAKFLRRDPAIDWEDCRQVAHMATVLAIQSHRGDMASIERWVWIRTCQEMTKFLDHSHRPPIIVNTDPPEKGVEPEWSWERFTPRETLIAQIALEMFETGIPVKEIRIRLRRLPEFKKIQEKLK